MVQVVPEFSGVFSMPRITPPYRICFWTTTFQADIHSFARYLDSHPDYNIMIALDDPEGFGKEAVQRFLPIRAPMLDKARKMTLLKLKLFRPHALVVDNHFPPLRFGRNLLVLWHGFGWKQDNLSGEFVHVHNNIKRLVGSGKRPNPHFLWQCYGEGDLKYRHEVSGFAEENLMVLGSAQADDLLGVKVDRENLAPFYSIDILSRKTVLLAFTWHHGKVLGHWGEDLELFSELFALGGELGVAFIIRMHDRFRYDPSYLGELERLVDRYKHVELRFKDDYRDNLLDMLISDVMVSNYSSIINRFYITGKPSIHIHPFGKGEQSTMVRKLKGDGTFVEEEAPEQAFQWKFPPEMIGGLLVHTMEGLKEKLAYALANPDCCREKSREFLEEHMGGTGGGKCEFIETVLRGMIEGKKR